MVIAPSTISYCYVNEGKAKDGPDACGYLEKMQASEC